MKSPSKNRLILSHAVVGILAALVTYLILVTGKPERIRGAANHSERADPTRQETPMPAPQGKLRAMANSREKGKIDLLDWVSFNEGKLLSRRARKCFQGYELEHAEYSGAVEDSEHTGVYYKFRKPSPAEIGSLIDQFVQSEDSPAAAEKNRAFIHELAGQYFDYPQQYRYASVMHGTGSDAPLLPTLVIRESDLDLSEEELDSHDGSGFSVSTAADLGVGDSLLERFGHLFSFEN